MAENKIEQSPPSYAGPPGQYQQQPPQFQQHYYPPPVMAQPANTTVVINQMSSEQQVKKVRYWTTGLCGCFDDCGVCCLVYWCSNCGFCGNIAGCMMSSEMGESCCLPCCVPGWLIALRTKLRTQLNIPGSILDDCCVVCCCPLCAHCQVWREFKNARHSGEL